VIEHANAGRTGDHLVSSHEDEVEAPRREVGPDASEKSETIRDLTSSHGAESSTVRLLGEIVSELPEAMCLVAVSAGSDEAADELRSGDV
jgi:hypothetical protein